MSASDPVERTDEHAVERHAAFLARAAAGPVDLLFIGDSITRRWAESPALWEKHYAHRGAANFGVGSDATQHVLWRIQHGELDGISPRVVVVLAGTNNIGVDPVHEIVEGVALITRTIQQKLKRTRVLLLALFPRRDAMELVRAVNAGLAALDNGGTVRFLDIGDAFLAPDGLPDPALMPDGLHCAEPGYVRWAARMEPLLSEMLS
jgi:lysophospholipase L1-like esterase